MKHPCVFKHPMIRAEVNPRLNQINPKTPYGAFQKAWRQLHCPQINPYGSESCPYRPEDCVLAYYKTATDALNLAETSPIGLFRILAKRRGMDRAENKPLPRDRQVEASDRRSSDPQGSRVHGPTSGPVRIGTVLGTLDVGTRQPRHHEGEESP